MRNVSWFKLFDDTTKKAVANGLSVATRFKFKSKAAQIPHRAGLPTRETQPSTGSDRRKVTNKDFVRSLIRRKVRKFYLKKEIRKLIKMELTDTLDNVP